MNVLDRTRPALVRFAPRPAAAVRLVCIGLAGTGAALFSSWRSRLPGWVEVVGVRLPGRESRALEAPLTGLADMADLVTGEILAELTGVPLAVYGHCFGGVLGHAIVARLEVEATPTPVRLFAANAPAPGGPRLFGGAELGDEQISGLLAAGAGPAGAFPETELAARADIRAMHAYPPVPVGPLRTPLSVFHATGDQVVPETLCLAWSACTRADFTYRTLPGSHYLLDTALDQVLAGITEDLRLDLGDPE